MKKSSQPTVGLNVTQVLVMAEDGINNSNFSNIRAVTPLPLRNSDKTIIWSYILSISFMNFSLSLSLSLNMDDLLSCSPCKKFWLRQYYMYYMILWNTLHCSTSSLAPYYFRYGDIALTFTYPYLYAYAAYPGQLYWQQSPHLINDHADASSTFLCALVLFANSRRQFFSRRGP